MKSRRKILPTGFKSIAVEPASFTPYSHIFRISVIKYFLTDLDEESYLNDRYLYLYRFVALVYFNLPNTISQYTPRLRSELKLNAPNHVQLPVRSAFGNVFVISVAPHIYQQPLSKPRNPVKQPAHRLSCDRLQTWRQLGALRTYPMDLRSVVSRRWHSRREQTLCNLGECLYIQPLEHKKKTLCA